MATSSKVKSTNRKKTPPATSSAVRTASDERQPPPRFGGPTFRRYVTEHATPSQTRTAIPTPPATFTQEPTYSPTAQAAIIKNTLFASLMTTAVGDYEMFTAAAFEAFIKELIREYGNSGDRLEQMQIEQLALAHYRIADLHAQAAGAKDARAVEAYTGAATRLMAEFRRQVMAIRRARQIGQTSAASTPSQTAATAEAPEKNG